MNIYVGNLSHEVTEEDLDQYLTTNLKGTYFLTQAVVPILQERGGGSIVNIGTVLVSHALGGVPASAAVSSKGAIHALTVQLAAEFGRDNIRVNTIAPGIVRTPIHARNGIEVCSDVSVTPSTSSSMTLGSAQLPSCFCRAKRNAAPRRTTSCSAPKPR